MKLKSVREIHDPYLKDPKFAAEYINVALESDDHRVILMAIRNVVAAQEGGFTAIADRAELGRESMYKMLSANGNPKLATLKALLNSLGLELKVTTRAD